MSKTTIKKSLCKAMMAGVITAGTLGVSVAAQASQWLMASGYADNNFMTRNLRELIADVEEQTGGDFSIRLHSNGSLIPLDGIRRSVQSGQVQMGEFRLGIYGNEDPMYVLDGVPFLANDYDRAWALMEAQREYFDELFGRLGLKVIAYQPWPQQGFYTVDPVDRAEDFEGKTMRVYSKYTQKMGEMLGARTVSLPFSEIPQAFATGMIDALITSPQTGIDTQVWDYTNYYTLVGATNTKNAIVVSQRAFDRLPEAHQTALLEAGERATVRGWQFSEEAFHQQLEMLAEKGLEVREASDEIMAELYRIGDVLTADWLDEADGAGVAVLDRYLAHD